MPGVTLSFQTSFINYDPNWINYYYEYEALVKRADIDLKHTLSLHFNTVDKMNVAMADKDYELAGRILRIMYGEKIIL